MYTFIYTHTHINVYVRINYAMKLLCFCLWIGMYFEGKHILVKFN